MKAYRRLIRCAAFLLVLAAAVCALRNVFAWNNQAANERQTGFQRERKGSLDGVYIGGSDVYCYWQPLFGWADHGIAIWDYSTSAMQSAAIRYYVEEAEKRQPDALFIISLNTFKRQATDDISDINIHRAVAYKPLTPTTLRLTHELVERSSFTWLDRLEFYLPIIRFHSQWDELEPWSLGVSDGDYKASMHGEGFMTKFKDLSGKLETYDGVEPISDGLRAIVEDLLDYCDGHKLNVLFVKVPQSLAAEDQRHVNTVQEMVTERGYPCLDLSDKIDELGLDPRQDFYDNIHTNVHGSLKFSKALGDYLAENYAFEDKRGQREWADWDESLALYDRLTGQYTLPIERDGSPRRITEIPAVKKSLAKKDKIRVTWEGIDGADGYIVYRRRNVGDDLTWHELAEADAEDRKCSDSDVESNSSYSYTVVPFFLHDGERVYGSFDIKGVTAKTEG